MKRFCRQLAVEWVGTAWLVFVGCGSAVLSGATPQGWSMLTMPLAFGLALTTAGCTFGRAYPAHFNPAVTVGLTVAQRFPVRDVLPFIAAQIAGALCGALLLAYVASGRPGFDLAASEFSANGFGEHSPLDYQLRSATIIESLGTFAFVYVYLVASRWRNAQPSSSLVIGACMALVYLLAVPITNASMNPARSTGPALLVGNWALDQLWLFWAAPLAGAVIAGLAYPRLCPPRERRAAATGPGEGESAARRPR